MKPRVSACLLAVPNTLVFLPIKPMNNLMKTNHPLTTCAKALVGAASLSLAMPLAALEKPAGDTGAKPAAQEAPKEKPAAADAAEQKAPKAAEKIAMLGIGGSDVSETLASHLGLPAGTGLTVYHVVPDSAAEKAGLEAHDVITAVGDRAIGSQDDLRAAVLAHKPGDEISVKFIHKGKAAEKKITLGERAAVPERGMDRAQGDPLGVGNDLLKMLQGMGANIPEADRKRMQEQMQKHVEQLRKQLQDGGGLQFDLKDLQMGKGIQMLGGTSVTIQDEQGSVTMKTVNGKKEVVVKDKEGKTVFEGPYDTEQDKAAVPDDVAERIKRVDMDTKEGAMRLRIGPGGIVPPPADDEQDAAE